MNQMLTAMANDEALGFVDLSSLTSIGAQASQAAKQQPKWQSVLTAIGTALPVGVAAYQSFRNPQPQFQPQAPEAPQRPEQEDRRRGRENDDEDGINTKLGFDLNKGLNIGGTRIPVLYLALGLGALFLLYKEPPKRGR
ncbi:MAG TPA: hypothetical protein PLD20_05825 [Blastocatellia bacterium]|nr:hypothetical protein [Blastocatellia bacterium]HMV87607.1 hypothetical protein [Blastocatellia bacterium]HMX24713.1 hypothetical protein [Blastocatellia bacterium]HMY73352.1 hypothetical protein [Blastocatellia bacterium]HMZ17426.1 hypothetical protein [Blastocatellia bacterium]